MNSQIVYEREFFNCSITILPLQIDRRELKFFFWKVWLLQFTSTSSINLNHFNFAWQSVHKFNHGHFPWPLQHLEFCIQSPYLSPTTAISTEHIIFHCTWLFDPLPQSVLTSALCSSRDLLHHYDACSM